MCKKLIMTCAAIAAFAAFGVAPVASASPVLTSEGKAVAIGKEVIGKNTGTIRFESENYVVECTSASLITKVTENTGTHIGLEAAAGAFTFSGTDVGSDCTTTWAPGKITWGKLCFGVSKGSDNVSITGCSGAVTMTTNLTELAVCTYTAESITATTSTGGDATLRPSSIPLVKKEGGFFCPAQIVFAFDLDLTTTGGETLSIS